MPHRSGRGEQTAEDHTDVESDQAMTEKALGLLDRPSPTAYSHALAEGQIDPRHLKDAQWQLAIDQVFKTAEFSADIHAVQRPPAQMEPFEVTPIRLICSNRPSRAVRVTAAFDALVVGLQVRRDELFRRIEERVHAMIEDGLEDAHRERLELLEGYLVAIWRGHGCGVCTTVLRQAERGIPMSFVVSL